MMRIAGAPISWGVCEVPGWGHQLPARRVLTEMHELGLTATEFGPDGFLPADPGERTALLASHGLEPVGGFVPVVLHDHAHDPLPEIDRALDSFGAGALLVLAAATGLDGYDERPLMDTKAWLTLLNNLDAITAHAAARGHGVALHPHVGTVVERPDEVQRILAGSSVPLCLDTGHVLIGGTDPLRLVRAAGPRIAHVHLKDVDAELARKVRGGELTYTQAVRVGLYRPLGRGDVDIAGIVLLLEAVGYAGWYVLEQDTILDGEPAAGAGPRVDAEASVGFLHGLIGVPG